MYQSEVIQDWNEPLILYGLVLMDQDGTFLTKYLVNMVYYFSRVLSICFWYGPVLRKSDMYLPRNFEIPWLESFLEDPRLKESALQLARQSKYLVYIS